MASSHRSRSKTSRPVTSEIAAAEVLAWLSDCIHGGLCFVCKGLLIFENSQFAELVESVVSGGAAQEPTLRKRLLDDAIAWNERDLGARKSVEYHLAAPDGRSLHYDCRFNVVPYRGERGVLMVLEDVTERVRLAQDAGLLINVTAERVIRLLPPLVLSDDEARGLVAILVPVIRGFLGA